jgi:hypothetical protein
MPLEAPVTNAIRTTATLADRRIRSSSSKEIGGGVVDREHEGRRQYSRPRLDAPLEPAIIAALRYTGEPSHVPP